MSAIGVRQAELQRQRLEQLRIAQVRQECSALLEACEQAFGAVRDPAVQQLASDALRQVRESLEQQRSLVLSSPEAAQAGLREVHTKLVNAITQAEAQAARWTEERASARAVVARARAQADIARKVAGTAGEPLVQKLEEQLVEAVRLEHAGQSSAVSAVLADAEATAAAARNAGLDETIRKEIVRGLLATLKAMGFVIEGPKKHESDVPGGQVVMVGRMPSGRRARFEIQLDGRFAFDLDGYEGRACAKDLDEIEKVLVDRFAVKFGPPQVTWKSPDKISKSALEDPLGGQSSRKGGR